VRAGAKVGSTDSDRLTALHVASQEGCVDCVRVLVDHGADVTALSRHGDTPLSLAARYGQLHASVYCALRLCVSVRVRALKGKRRELSTPNLVDIYSMEVGYLGRR